MKQSSSVAPKDNKRNTSLRLDTKTLKALKVRAIENDTSIQSIVEELITAYLDKRPKSKKRRK